MKLARRALLGALLTGGFLWQSPAFAAWPEKPIRLVVPFAGGMLNNLSRILAEGLQQRLGQPVIVDAKPGGGGIVGFQFVKSSAPDGYTLLLGTQSTLTLLPSMQKSMPFDGLKDFEHIGMAFVGSNIIVVNSASPIKSLADLQREAKANPGKLTFGSAGNGTSFHVAPELFDKVNGSKMVHIPYKGAGPAFMGLLSNETSVVFGSTDSLPHIQAGKMRALAVMSKRRLAAAPEIPTTAELGMPELFVEAFYGLLAPAGTPKEIVERLNKEMTAVLASPTTQAQLKTLAMESAPDTSRAYFIEQIRSETARWRPIIQNAGITAE